MWERVWPGESKQGIQSIYKEDLLHVSSIVSKQGEIS